MELTDECFFRNHLMHQGERYTVTEYLNRPRIQAAKNLLTSTDKLSLDVISAQVGIPDEKYFVRLFKRCEGVTATAYREAFSRKLRCRI